MIVSHKHKFIFVHLGRTSGTSIERMLRPFLGADDIVGERAKRIWSRRQFCKHSTAVEIRRIVGEAVWRTYFKFTFERNPFEKILTKYWSYAGAPPRRFYKRIPLMLCGRPLSFATWFRAQVWAGRLFRFGRIAFPRHYRCYTDRGQVIVDFIGRFENRSEHLRLLGQHLGLPLDPGFHAGNSHRKEGSSYVDWYDPWMRRVVEAYYRRDLGFLGYEFGETDPTDVAWDREQLATASQRQTRRAA